MITFFPKGDLTAIGKQCDHNITKIGSFQVSLPIKRDGAENPGHTAGESERERAHGAHALRAAPPGG